MFYPFFQYTVNIILDFAKNYETMSNYIKVTLWQVDSLAFTTILHRAQNNKQYNNVVTIYMVDRIYDRHNSKFKIVSISILMPCKSS